jgi:hypothetical protein
MACDPNQLLLNARCFQCLSQKELQMVVTYLLCQISIGSGGSASPQLVTYTVAPPANPPDTSKPAVAYDPTGNLPILGWNTNTLTWN